MNKLHFEAILKIELDIILNKTKTSIDENKKIDLMKDIIKKWKDLAVKNFFINGVFVNIDIFDYGLNYNSKKLNRVDDSYKELSYSFKVIGHTSKIKNNKLYKETIKDILKTIKKDFNIKQIDIEWKNNITEEV